MRAYLPDYDLVEPANLASVLALLGGGEGWRPMAGGTDLMVLVNGGRVPAGKFVSIRRVPELRFITGQADALAIGSTATFSDLRWNGQIGRHFPLLAQAASWTGGMANQNRATIGGNVANASPAADSAPVLLIHEAEIEVMSEKGVRRVPYDRFHQAYKRMDLRPDELISRICLPVPREGWRYYGRKVGARKAQAISKVSMAACGRRLPNGGLECRIALGSVMPVPYLCKEVIAFLRQERFGTSAIGAAQALLRREIAPITDIRSTSAYRSAVAANLLAEFLESFL